MGDRCQYRCDHGSGAQCTSCTDGFLGEYCQLAPAYIVSNSTQGSSNGRYERLADAECNGKPVYQLGGYNYVLFQPTDTSYWLMGPSGRAADCLDTVFIRSNGDGGVCPLSPDGGGCVGRWQEYDGNAWQDAPSLTVRAGER